MPFVPLVDGNAALQIGKTEGGLAIPAIGGANQVVKRFVCEMDCNAPLQNDQSNGREVESDQTDFTDVLITHP